MRVLVAGASGFIGRHLCPALEDAGHDVWAMTRRPERYDGAGRPVAGDVQDSDSVIRAMTGCDAAFYLVHSLGARDFRRRDAEAARTFARAADRAGLRRIVYLGGLGDDRENLSEHLISRQEVAELLAGGPVPVTTLRAGIIIGHGGIDIDQRTSALRRHLATQPHADVDTIVDGILTRSGHGADDDVVALAVRVS